MKFRVRIHVEAIKELRTKLRTLEDFREINKTHEALHIMEVCLANEMINQLEGEK